MIKEYQHTSGPAHAKKPHSGKRKLLIGVLIVCLIGLIVFGGFFFWSVINQPAIVSSQTEPNINSAGKNDADRSSGEAQAAVVEMPHEELGNFQDRSVTEAQRKAEEKRRQAIEEAKRAEEEAQAGFPIPLIAEYDGVLLHSPIHPKDLEAILFHQASFETALVLSTQLPDANPETMLSNPDYKITEEQPTGDEWLNALALHLWREDTPTSMDTSIDVGAEAGSQVYAPVSGTVVLVRTYKLYDVCDDYEIHIQPDGRPDLDVVEIHVSDVTVKPGDKVVGGVTPMAKVRDLTAEDITDIQLAFYTKEGHGNHTHVQVNNADYPEYRETRLKDAYKVE